jgi:2'-5' RNA ligase
MRLFFGVPVSEDVRDRVRHAQDRLRSAAEKVTWVQPANFHFTLRFLGDVPAEEGAGAEAAAEGSWATLEAPEVSLRGVGCFPHARRPRVVWVGLAGGRGALAQLAANLSERLEAHLGWSPEERGFTPHLTIGRVKVPPRGETLGRLIDGLADEEFGQFVADRFVLYQSTLTPQGPIYRAVRVYGAPGAETA